MNNPANTCKQVQPVTESYSLDLLIWYCSNAGCACPVDSVEQWWEVASAVVSVFIGWKG